MVPLSSWVHLIDRVFDISYYNNYFIIRLCGSVNRMSKVDTERVGARRATHYILPHFFSSFGCKLHNILLFQKLEAVSGLCLQIEMRVVPSCY